jgi:outer membrane lipoprotein carrier protein
MSLRTDFTQTVTDAQGAQIESGSGSLVVQRPDRFRWDYEPGAAGSGAAAAGNADQGGQLLVADGSNLWFYDRELAQVTVKPIDAALSSTPIMLLSGSAATLRASFDIRAAGSHDGLQWVDVKPRSEQADFNDAQLGFKAGQLARMVFHNALGQNVQLDFAHSERNGRIDAAAFAFKAPAGVDVIGTPQH